jgi:hypothetical protein
LLSAYVECALWSSTDEDGEALDAVYTVDDLAPEALASMQAECEDFVALLEQESIDWSDWSDEQLGHDFWLTRNGHGAGFWDRGYALGDRLTALCKPYGSSDLYVDEDGSVYVT